MFDVYYLDPLPEGVVVHRQQRQVPLPCVLRFSVG